MFHSHRPDVMRFLAAIGLLAFSVFLSPPLHAQDGNGAFLRYARDLAPDVAVEHHVPDHAEARVAGGFEELVQALGHGRRPSAACCGRES